MKKHELSARTLAEQAAGRNQIELAVHYELLDTKMGALRRKFPTLLQSPHLAFHDEHQEWMVEVRIQTASGSFMNFKEPFLGWPSEMLIANLTLVEP
jgi:hypothetical protein